MLLFEKNAGLMSEGLEFNLPPPVILNSSRVQLISSWLEVI